MGGEIIFNEVEIGRYVENRKKNIKYLKYLRCNH